MAKEEKKETKKNLAEKMLKFLVKLYEDRKKKLLKKQPRKQLKKLLRNQKKKKK